MSTQSKYSYEFGPFRLTTQKRLLSRSGEAVPLTSKLFDILLLLVQNSGNLIGKDDLMREIWPDSFVGENNLTVNISALRKVLGESDRGTEYIETVPRHGYRFIAPVRQVQDDSRSTDTHDIGRIVTIEEGASQRDNPFTSLAVLPIINVSNEASIEYLSDGITYSIINSISKLPQLRVVACSTVFRYKGQDIDPLHIGRELSVQAVLVGRIIQLSDCLIIRTELIDVRTGWQLWGEQYNCNGSDILSVQEDISQKISGQLCIKLTREQKGQLIKRDTDNHQAYRLYLKGRYYWNKYTREGMKLGLECFHQAIDLDPNYALAYAGLADSYYRLSNMYMPAREAMPKAKAAAIKALDIDATLAEAHISLGLVKMHYDWDWLNAEKEYKRAIELAPRNASAHQRYGIYLNQLGLFNEAMAELKLAQELDPLSLQISVNIGTTFFLARQYDRAIEQARKTLEIESNFLPAHILLGVAYEQEGRFLEAIAEFQSAKEIADSQTILGYLGYTYAVSGKKNEALRVLDELKARYKRSYVSSYNIALIYINGSDIF